MTILCPCGSESEFEQCCQPAITGVRLAATPEVLMRSRYSAYVTKNADYLISSWHPDCHAADFRHALLEGFESTQWLGLQVIATAAGKNADEGFVEFSARYQDSDGSAVVLVHERSRFLRANERWYYIDGIKPQTGRNDPCPCGSGKKYKKCCAQ
ncbi:hypothetical protein BS639_07875 [Rouxiella silvae]|uniref:UPF0225 protein BS639_07875 n=1 Tax=Rouxiella silvae TaxID=1646373 RepID=A0ABX3U2U8_9GAMM|nr:YchJ family protein [Rouxiella silvae]ORJ21860.1 hypothetical protein BS639_07875 [Rouxiella silvae]